jgi:hypothetical protein
MSLLKISGIVTIVGSIIFLVAAFVPISSVYALPTAESKLKLITDSLEAWRFSQVLFSAGVIITAVGIAVAAFALKDRPSAPFVVIAAVLLIVGAAAWSWSVYLRATDPAAFANGTMPGWHFVLYSLLTMAAFLLIGIACLQLGLPAWAGWVLIVGSILFFVLYIIFKDMPPFVYYLMGVALGVALISAG